MGNVDISQSPRQQKYHQSIVEVTLKLHCLQTETEISPTKFYLLIYPYEKEMWFIFKSTFKVLQSFILKYI